MNLPAVRERRAPRHASHQRRSNLYSDGKRTNYHKKGNYSRARQELQDKIVRKMLDGTTITDETNGSVCTTPTEPWIVFTAGVMVSFSFSPVRYGRSLACDWDVRFGG
jgi:hypothetical protein